MSNLAGLTQMLQQGVQQSELARMAAMSRPSLPEFGGGWPGAQLGMQLAQRKQQAQMQQQGANQRAMQQMLSRAMMQQQRLKQQAMVEKTRQAEAAQRSAMQQEGMALRREAGTRAGETHDLAVKSADATAKHREWLYEQDRRAPETPREIRHGWTPEQWIRDGLGEIGAEQVPASEFTEHHWQLGRDRETKWMGGSTITERTPPPESTAHKALIDAEVETPTPETIEGKVNQAKNISITLSQMTPGEVIGLLQSIKADAKTPAGGEELIRIAQGYDIGDVPITVQTEEELEEIFDIRKAAGVPEIEWIRSLTGPAVDDWRRKRVLQRQQDAFLKEFEAEMRRKAGPG